MKVKEFIDLIDWESVHFQGVTFVIAIKEKCVDNKVGHLADYTISDKEKIIVDASEYNCEDYEFYEQYGIEVCFKSNNEEDENYEQIDVKYSEDNYKYVYNEDGEIWVIVY